MLKTLERLALRATALATLSVGMVACGGGGSADGTPPPSSSVTFSVGGVVTGLSGAAVVLRNNGADDLAITTNGSFRFAASVKAGEAYAVTIGAHPAGQTCMVSNGTGTANAQVDHVAVNCIPALAFDPAAAFDVGRTLIEDISGDVFGVEAAAATHPDGGTSLVVHTQRDAAGELNVFATVLSADGQTSEQTLIGLANARYAGSVRVKYGPKGKAIAIWHQDVGGIGSRFEVIASVYAAGQWGGPTRIGQALASDSSAVGPDIAFDKAGNAVAVWSAHGPKGSQGIRSAAFSDSTSSWEAPKLVAEFPTGEILFNARIVMLGSTPAPNYLVVTQRALEHADAGKIVAYRCVADRTAACEAAGVDGGPFLPMQQDAARVSAFDLGSNDAGDVVVVWRQSGTHGNVLVTSRPAGFDSDWREGQVLTSWKEHEDVSLPQVHVTSGGAALMAWSRRSYFPSDLDEEDGVFVRRFAPSSTGPMAPSATVALATGVFTGNVILSVTPTGEALAVWDSAHLPSVGLFSSTFDAGADTPTPSSAARVAANPSSESFPIAVSRGADGRGVALWLDSSLEGNDLVTQLRANRYK